MLSRWEREVVGCAERGKGRLWPDSDVGIDSPASELGGTAWQFVKFEGGDGTALTPDDKAKYTLAFEADGNVSVRIDCNRGRGAWQSSGSKQLTFGPIALTRAMPTWLPPRSHRQGFGVRSNLHDQGCSSLSGTDGRRRYLRVRAAAIAPKACLSDGRMWMVCTNAMISPSC